MEKGSKRAGANREKAGNSFKKNTERTGGDKAYNKRDSFKKSDDERPKRPFKKAASSGDERPKRTFSDRKQEEGAPRKQWGERDQESRPKRTFDKPGKERNSEDRPSRKGKDFEEKRPFDKPRRSFNDREDKPAGEKRTFGEKRNFDKPRKSFEDRAERPTREKKSFGEKRDFDKPRKSFEDRAERPTREKKGFGEKRDFDKPRKSFEDRAERPTREKKSFGEKRDFDKPRKSFEDREEKPTREKKSFGEKRDFDKPRKSKDGEDKPKSRRSFESEDLSIGARKKDSRPFRERNKSEAKKATTRELKEGELPPAPDKVYKELEEAAPKREFKSHKAFKKEVDFDKPEAEDLMPLNKYIAHSGECSRRDAAELVRQGKVKVNGELILDPGHKVNLSDDVTLLGKKMKPQKGMVYILLNKPKGFITTNDDPQGRKTVMDLVANSGIDRLFAVGRLDRNTTGLLLMTNDGLLAQKLAHPSYQIKKVYHVTLDKPLTKADFEKVINGVTLDDGIANVDALAYLEAKNELGLEIHSGRNRIVRRIFESLGYVVEKLDRVMYAGLTKKNLPRSKWRFLDDREIVLLKHFKS